MSWLCGCGNGELDTFGNPEVEPPEYCEVCGLGLWEYFGLTEEE